MRAAAARPVALGDDEALVAPLDDEVGVDGDAEVFVVHLRGGRRNRSWPVINLS